MIWRLRNRALGACAGLLIASGASGGSSDVAAQTSQSNPAIDDIFASYDGPDRPGCAVGVYRDGGIFYARGYGMANLELNVPNTPSTIFDLGSTSKQISATAVVLLAQDGRLSLDDDVRKLIPELPQYQRPITIRHLLNHTSGMRDYIGLLSMGGARYDDVTTSADALNAIVRQRELNFEPGAEHLYSNSGYFLLSVIVERASGKSLRDFARERIFDPLGMQRSHILGSYDDIVPGRASGYSPRGPGTPVAWRLDMPRWLQTGDGAVFSSVEELLLWDRNFYTPTVGGRPLLDALHTRGILNNGDTIPYALGLMLGRYRGALGVRHGGSWGGYRAELLRFPDHATSVAVLCNAGNANPALLANRVADVVLGDVLGPATAPPAGGAPGSPPPQPQPYAMDAATLATYAGRYYSPELDTHFSLVVADGRLVVHRRNAGPQTLTPVAPDEFRAGGVVIRVVRDGGRVSGFLMDLGRIRNLRFDRID